MAAVAGGVGDGDLAPWQALELLAQRGLVGLDDQQPGGVLVGDQPLGVLALGMHGIGRHDGVGQVQALQQRPEPGDLVGGVIHLGLCQDRAGGVVHRRQQVHRRGVVVAAAAQGLAVHRDRPTRPAGCRRSRAWGWLLGGQPSADGLVQRGGADAGQHTAHGRLGGWGERAGQRVAAGPERGQDRRGRVLGPFADRGQGPGAGQDRTDRDGEHAGQEVSSAAAVAGVGDVGEVGEQAAALAGRHRDGRGRMGDGRDG
jgi:hypothetical protein